jgi:hypothetical protein
MTTPTPQPLRVYVTALWNAEKVIAKKLGDQDIRRADISLRVGLIMLNLVLASFIQILVGAGIVTDAQIQARFDALANAPLKRQPDFPPGDDVDLGTSAEDPDVGA